MKQHMIQAYISIFGLYFWLLPPIESKLVRQVVCCCTVAKNTLAWQPVLLRPVKGTFLLWQFRHQIQHGDSW